ncbi:hypothetical protein BH10BAC5_BH10BAC5_09190 [soil metagenome]
MIEGKLIELISSFSKNEIKEFKKYTDSPFFNNDSSVKTALKEILSCYPDFQSPQFTKENIYSKLYPGKDYNDSRIRNIFSDLLRLARDYIALEKYKQIEYECEKMLLLDHDKRKLDGQFILLQKNLRERLEKEKNSETKYSALLDLEKITGEFNYSRNNKNEIIKSSPLQGEYLIITFLYKLLKLNIQIYKDEHNYNIKHDKLLLNIMIENLDLEKLLKEIKKNYTEYYPLIAIYFQIYRSQQNIQEVKYYSETLKLFETYLNELSEKEKFYILHNLATICIDKIHTGYDEFKHKLFRLYKRMNELEMLYDSPESKNMSLLMFRNVLLISLRVSETIWAENFLKTNIDKIQKDSAENMINYSMALIEQEKKNYNKALEHASKVKMEFSNFKYDIKVITLRCYYELDETEPALYQLTNFKLFLKQNREIPDKSRETFVYFAGTYEKLLKLKLNFDEFEFKMMEKELNNTHSAFNNWFTDKMHELKKSNKMKNF